MVETRVAGYAPVVVRRRAPSKDEVISSALDGVRGALGRLLDRIDTVARALTRSARRTELEPAAQQRTVTRLLTGA
jgi:hypothetical protein